MQSMAKPATTLEGLIAEDPFPNSSTSEEGDLDNDNTYDVSGAAIGLTSKNQVPTGNHHDVSEEEGRITIPCKKLPDDWSDASDILQLCSLDRPFVFPGEQLHIMVCLSASKQDTEVITPFKVAAVMSKHGSSALNIKQQIENLESKSTSSSGLGNVNGSHEVTTGQGLDEEDGEFTSITEKMGSGRDISATESLRLEDHKQKTETLLERFRNSNFFVRIAQSDEPLWSKRNAREPSSMRSEMEGERLNSNDGVVRKTLRTKLVNTVIDRGSCDGTTSGGVARNNARCYSLCNGDIVVLLQVNVANIDIKDPVLEVLQFEKFVASTLESENLNGLLDDPCRELLNWLLPLDRTLPSLRPLSPPLNSASVLTSVSQKATPSVSSSSQIFSFGHFRSYSMPTLPQVTGPLSAVSPSNSKPAFDLEDFDRLSIEKLTEIQDKGNEGLLSFRGVPLEPERFSVHCGLEGIYLPGRRWRRKLEIIQPIEIHSFAAECITEDLICVQIKNVCPAHVLDIVIFLDAVTIVFEEASKGGSPQSQPIASIETGNGHTLPNLALRRGEEHSFILKPANILRRDHKGPNNTHSKLDVSASNLHLASRVIDGGRRISQSADQYAVLVSWRCNYTESKLFFKQPTSWRPRVARDFMISAELEMLKQSVGPKEETPQLPVQVLTLQASNLTSEDLTLTVVAPISSISSPSVVSLNSGPTTPMSSFIGFPEFMGRVGVDKNGTEGQKDNDADEKRSISDVLNTDLGYTHLWLQSSVPLGCVPAHSSATVKLDLLPLTDGIIALDTLQVAVKEKGQMYAPEQPLKIYVTSSISTGIV